MMTNDELAAALGRLWILENFARAERHLAPTPDYGSNEAASITAEVVSAATRVEWPSMRHTFETLPLGAVFEMDRYPNYITAPPERCSCHESLKLRDVLARCVLALGSVPDPSAYELELIAEAKRA